MKKNRKKQEYQHKKISHKQGKNKSPFKLVSSYKPEGDQPQAIKQIVQNFKKQQKWQTLLGVTGSGKTFTMAHVLAQIKEPGLILAPNKTLAAQLFIEIKELFPTTP